MEPRKRVTDTKMSVDAQNVKIITQDGRVTLRGPVKSDEERNAIEEIATDVAGADNVTNELEVSN
jgi:osmotically-inducible protein OsmY